MHNTVDNGPLTITKHLVDDLALGITHSVNNHLLCRLGGNAAQIGNIIHFFTKIIIELNFGIKPAGLCENNLRIFVKDFFNNRTILKDLNFTQFLIKLDLDIAASSVFFPHRRPHGLFNGIDQQGAIYPLIPTDLIKYPL